MLFACPDDSVDPVKPGEPYDEKVYHTFVRPPGWIPLRQRTTSEPPAPGDWVVIENWSGPVDVNGKTIDMPLDRSEGILVAIEDQSLKVALGGNEGIGGAGSGGQGTLGGVYAVVPKQHVFVMILPVLKDGDKVRVTRGPLRGEEGIIAGMRGGSIEIGLERGLRTLPIEFIEKIYPTERR